RVSRGRIGVQIDQVTRDVAESIGLGRPQGALVRSVENGSPAAAAGIEAGDIITKFNGQAIDRATELPRLVGNTKPGSRVAITVVRRGAARDLAITVAEIEADQRTASSSSTPSEPARAQTPAARTLGLAVSELTEAQKRETGVKGGVVVDVATE